MKTILITGGSGLFGVNAALVLRSGYRVVLAMHRCHIEIEGCSSTPLDLVNPVALRAGLEAISPDFVIHGAALADVDQCQLEPERARLQNVELSENIAAICASLGLSLAYLSSDQIFDGRVPHLDELARPAPLSVYAQTKHEAERRVLARCPSALVVRTNFYGWGTSYRYSFSDFIYSKLSAGEEVNLFTDLYYTPLLVTRLVEAVVNLLEMDVRGVINIVGDERCSKYEFGCQLCEFFDWDATRLNAIVEPPRPAPRPAEMSLDNQKLCALLGRSMGNLQGQFKDLRAQLENGHAKELAAL